MCVRLAALSEEEYAGGEEQVLARARKAHQQRTTERLLMACKQRLIGIGIVSIERSAEFT